MTARAFASTRLARYGLGLTAAFLAWLLRELLNGWFPPGFPYLTFFPAVVVTAYFAGLGPAILCAVLSGLAAWYFFIPPYGAFSMSFGVLVAVLFYAFVVAIDIFFIDGMRRAMRSLAVERERHARLAESRDLLYRELHHRVSNNIQVVGALLRLQAAGVRDGDARHALNEAGGRIELVAKIQRELHDPSGEPMAFRAFAEDLLADARAAAGVEADLRVTGGDRPLSSDHATPVTLVLLECVNNAMEHGFANSASPGTIDVHMDDAGAVHVLTVRDDGAGPPEGFDLAATGSLGLRIVQAMAAQLRGEFTITRADGATISRLTYPAPQA